MRSKTPWKRWRDRLLALVLGTALAFVVVGVGMFVLVVFLAVSSPWGRPGDRAASRQHELALAELGRLGEHPWAGVYRTPGPWPDELVLAPAAGFTLFHGSMCANCQRWVQTGGIVAASDSRLAIRPDGGFELPPEEERSAAWYELDETLYLVPWGELRFAVPSWRMERFCAEASHGSTFPSVPFRAIGGRTDSDPEQPTRPPGLPEVPEEYRHLIPR